MAYAVETCPGFEHPPGCLDMDALGQARCTTCGWSWHAHRSRGRPHPPSPPPDYDDEAIARAFADFGDDDDEPAGPDAGRAGGGEGE